MEKYGGLPGVIVAVPEIDIYPISSETDFIMLGSDGVFDHLENS